jgi:hypothetical protein
MSREPTPASTQRFTSPKASTRLAVITTLIQYMRWPVR